MRCPKCGELAPEGAAICQNCNEILDDSFLQGADDSGDVEGERTDVGPAPTAARPSNVRPLRPQLARPTALKAAATRGNWNTNKANIPEEAAPERPRPAPPPQPKPAPLPDGDAMMQAAASIDDFGNIYKSLPTSDRLASIGAALALISLILPWRWTKADEEVIGFVEATPVLFLAGAVLACIYFRVRRGDPKLLAPLQLGQVLGSALGALYSANCIRVFADATASRQGLKTFEIATSMPKFGAYLGAGALALAVMGSLWSAFERR